MQRKLGCLYIRLRSKSRTRLVKPRLSFLSRTLPHAPA